MIQELTKHQVDVEGFDKTIDEGAMTLVMDIAQTNQYQYPYQSMVRELTSNAKDSIEEKKIAKEILTGKAKPEDYYIQREEELYKDSNWDEEYYELEYLSDNDDVVITYIEDPDNKEVGHCDLFIVRDEGVGLGESRILGFTKLGYSTKRNSQKVLGSFGLGAKSPLSTNTEYYIVESSHNGKTIMLKIFDYKIVSLVPPFNLETGKPNPFYKYNVGDKEIKIHYLETEGPNYTEIITPCRTVGRNKIDKAIKETLPYVKGVKYFYHTKNEDSPREIKFQPHIEYESDKILVTNNSRWSNVEVGIVKDIAKHKHDMCISYGHIDFSEMGMTDIRGAITVKVPIRSVVRDPDTGKETVLQEGIDVVPSREFIRYTPHTISFLKKRFKQAAEEASKMVEEKLSTNDFVQWLSSANSILTGSRYKDDVFSKLSDIVDVSQINPKFKKDSSIEFTSVEHTLRGLNVRKVYLKRRYASKLNQHVTSIERDRVSGWSDIDWRYIYVKTSKASKIKDLYLIKSHSSFTMIDLSSEEAIRSLLPKADRDNDDLVKEMLDYGKKVFSLISESVNVKSYDSIAIPDHITEQLKKEIDSMEKNIAYEKEVVDKTKIDNEKRRKSNKLTLAYTFNKVGKTRVDSTKREIPIAMLTSSDDVYYGTSEDEETFMQVTRTIPWNAVPPAMPLGTSKIYGSKEYHYHIDNVDTDGITLLLVSKSRLKHFKHLSEVSTFFELNMDKKVIGPNEYVVKSYTAYKAFKILESYRILLSFKDVDHFIYNEALEVYEYIIKHKPLWYQEDETYLKELNKLHEIEKKLWTSSNPKEIITSFLKDSNAEDIIISDRSIITKAELLAEYCEPIHSLVEKLRGVYQTHNRNLAEIKEPAQTNLKSKRREYTIDKDISEVIRDYIGLVNLKYEKDDFNIKK